MRAECKQQQAEKQNNEWGKWGQQWQHMNLTTRASICELTTTTTAATIYDCRGRSPASMRLVI